MKKVLSLLLCALMLVSMTVLSVSAVDYDQPFDKGTLGSKTYRIPAIYTLNNGSVIAGADIRYDHGADAPNNIDIAVAISENGYTNWNYSIINYFDDYKDGVTDTHSASFIDSAIAQSSTGRIFVVSDVCPSDNGYLQAKKGSGYAVINGKRYMLLTSGDSSDDLDTFAYYIGENGVVYNRADKTATEYYVDAEFRLYKNGTALMMNQYGSEGVKVQQNIFYGDAELCCYQTTYLWMRYSDDNGKTWSAPVILSQQIKAEDEGFLGIGPGRGLVTTLADGTERIIFCVYDNVGMFYDSIFENASVIYSDDNGVTWKRSDEVYNKLGLGKTSEAQVVDLGNGVIRMYARNSSNFIAYADSKDGGATWTDFVADDALEGTKNCMISFINTSKTINGKKVILCSAGSNTSSRADGVIRVGLVDAATSDVEWIKTYSVNTGFFAYSCMTELADGNFGLLYEDESYHIQYMIFSVDGEGNITEINGNNNEDTRQLSFWDKVVKFFKDLFNSILSMFGML